MFKHKLSSAGFLLLLSGCGGSPVQDDLSIHIAQEQLPLRISTLCADATCEALQQLHAEIRYAAGLAQTEVVELDQYRVDYELDGVKGTVPFFAARKKLSLSPGASAQLILAVSGQSQRSFLIKQVGHATVSGSGQITFAGYDHDNGQVLLKTQFELEFGEIVLSPTTKAPNTPTKSTADGGTRSDAGKP